MKTVLVSTLLGLLLVACASPPPPATPMTFESADAQANHQKQISLEGYMSLPVAALVSDTMLIDLYEKPGKQGRCVSVSCRIGSGKNCVEKPPKDYKESDFKLHANDGSLVSSDAKVKVAGKLLWSKAVAPGKPNSLVLFAPVDIQKI